MNVFDEMGVYWAEIADQNQTERQVEFLKKALKPEGLVLDLACGSGRHLIGLGKAGFDVVGLDVSFNLLKVAKSRFHGAQLVRGDMRFLPFKEEAFAAAVSMDTSFGYLPSENDDLQSLCDMHRCLTGGGLLIVDVFNRERLAQQYGVEGKTKSWRYPSFVLEQKRSVDVDGGWLRDLWTVHDKADGQTHVFEHLARLYTETGLRDMLEASGFKVTTVYGDYERQQWQSNSSRLILVANN